MIDHSAPVKPAPEGRVPTIAAWGGVPVCFFYRCRVPLRGLERAGLCSVAGIRMLDHTIVQEDNYPVGDVVVVHRMDNLRVRDQFLPAARESGALIVADDDDDLFSLSVHDYEATEQTDLVMSYLRRCSLPTSG